MQLILAIDILNGKVVKAFAGLRINYKPLFLKNEDFSNPIKLIIKIRKKVNLMKVYIADLNSISKNGSNEKLIDTILTKFPDLMFLIDAGFDYPISVYNYHSQKIANKISNYKIVLGTETLKNFNLKSFNILGEFELSLDFNGNQRKWLKKIKKERIPTNVILMFLDRVGGRGLDLPLIKSLYKYLVFKKITVAGGVRTKGEVAQLSRIGVQNVLSSTLLHKSLSRDVL